MTITSTMTAGEAVTKALRVMGVVGRQANPNAGQMDEGLESLNWMLKSWAADGLNLWRYTTATLTLASGDADYTLSPKPVSVFNARYVYNTSYERPMQQITLDDYLILPDKTQSGDPVLWTTRETVGGVELLIWPVPTAAGSLKYDYARVFEDVLASDDTLDIKQEWTECVFYCLAAELLTSYNLHDIRPATAGRIEARAAQLKRKLEDHDRPAYIFMGAE